MGDIRRSARELWDAAAEARAAEGQMKSATIRCLTRSMRRIRRRQRRGHSDVYARH